MNTYNLYISTSYDTYNILGINSSQLEKVVAAYKQGRDEFTLGGKKYWLEDLHEFKIFTHEHKMTPSEFRVKAVQGGLSSKSFGGTSYLRPRILENVGKDVTDDFIGNTEYGEETMTQTKSTAAEKPFIDPTRIEELRKTVNQNFDLSRLIRFCEEINNCFANKNYLSIAMLGRSILNHVPPIFGFNTFNEVANNHGGTSFKKIMDHLNTTMRGIADSFLHDPIRKNESLPNSTQINFSQDLDVLLAEIIRKLKEK